jgi:hypothetical protein
MIAANNLSPEEPQNPGGLGPGVELLDNSYDVTRDARMIARAVRNGWNIEKKQPIVERLHEIVEKRSVQVPAGKDGELTDSEGLADKNSIAAAKVLVQMNGQDQADDHLIKGKTIHHDHSVTVVDQRSRLAAIAQRFGVDSVFDAVPAGSETVDTCPIDESQESESKGNS